MPDDLGAPAISTTRMHQFEIHILEADGLPILVAAEIHSNRRD